MDRLDEAVADRFGLHRTDLRCLEIIGRAAPVAAGRLATMAGLSTSAVTAMLDRTERAGYVRRSADPSDRRRVLVDLTGKGRESGRAAFTGLMRETDRLLGSYTLAELELLNGFLARVCAVVVAQAEIATSETGRSGGGAERSPAEDTSGAD
ncbi:MAG: MarR family transcriptional regulator [Actinomycetota bacterium]|nr:MarR family transcriptional regulator [Actinomycetota bacterium]